MVVAGWMGQGVGGVCEYVDKLQNLMLCLHCTLACSQNICKFSCINMMARTHTHPLQHA